MSAFSDGVECSVPSVRSGETPDPYDFCDFKVYSQEHQVVDDDGRYPIESGPFGQKVKVNFVTLFKTLQVQYRHYRLKPILFRLHMYECFNLVQRSRLAIWMQIFGTTLKTLQYLLNCFQTSDICWSWDEELDWFCVMASKIKANFGTWSEKDWCQTLESVIQYCTYTVLQREREREREPKLTKMVQIQ